ncbi:hypothetical protein F5X98DRAFT_347721 [Xylaria grammica]|nr:hypothetical protein F5X98DRAFT_347721 [Xylaria grammica]
MASGALSRLWKKVVGGFGQGQPVPGSTACSKGLHAGNRYASRELQAKGLTYALHRLIVSFVVEKFYEATLVLVAGHEICIQRHAVAGAGAGYGEISGAGGGTWASRAPRHRNKNKSSRPKRRDRDDDDRPGQRRNKSRSGPPTERLPFACPFYHHNNEEHQRCLNHTLNRIVDVRQHIRRCHAQPSYCPRCGVVFQNDPTYDQRDAHINQQTCADSISFLRPSGATSEQLESMDNAAHHRNGTREERWYDVWDIMFPGTVRPGSPYIDVTYERRRIEVRDAVVSYRENGGLQDFIHQYTNGIDLQWTLNLLLNHLTNYNHNSAGVAGARGRDDALGDVMMAEAQPASSVFDLPVLLPRPTQMDSVHPSLDPNLDVDDDDYEYDDDYEHGYFDGN